MLVPSTKNKNISHNKFHKADHSFNTMEKNHTANTNSTQTHQKIHTPSILHTYMKLDKNKLPNRPSIKMSPKFIIKISFFGHFIL